MFLGLCLLYIQCRNTSSNQEDRVPLEIDNEKQMTVQKTQKYQELLNLDFVLGRYNPSDHSSLSKIPKKYTDKEGIYMHTEALDQFILMYEDAKSTGIDLLIRSATRNFNYQKSIWEAKWNGRRILSNGINAATDISDPTERALEIMKYSAMPGASRHHWGTDIDLNAFDNAYFESGKGKVLYEWLVENAHSYGYYLVYTSKGPDRPNGYEEEKWHWTYKPISKHLTAFAKIHIKDSLLNNFSGSEYAGHLNVVKNYILGIHHECH